jgi:hypothetical protein
MNDDSVRSKPLVVPGAGNSRYSTISLKCVHGCNDRGMVETLVDAHHGAMSGPRCSRIHLSFEELLELVA